MLNKVSSLFMTELDVLDDLENIQICHRYKLDDQIVDGILPPLISDFGRMVPEYLTVKGWKDFKAKNNGKGIADIEKFDQLPVNAQSFVREIEKAIKVEIAYISVNNEEDEGIIRIIR